MGAAARGAERAGPGGRARSGGRGALGGGALEPQVLREVHAGDPEALGRVLVEKASAGRALDVEKLLAVGVSASARDSNGEPALSAATVAGHRHVVEALLDGGADPLLVTSFQETALHVASRMGFTDIAGMIVRAAQRASIAFDLLKVQNYMGAQALHVAAEKGHADICELLVGAGADLHAGDHSGRTPLHLATYWSQHATIVALLKGGADPYCLGGCGETVFQTAEECGNLDVANMLQGHMAELMESKVEKLQSDIMLEARARVAAQKKAALLERAFARAGDETERMKQAMLEAQKAIAHLQERAASAERRAEVAEASLTVSEGRAASLDEVNAGLQERVEEAEARAAKAERSSAAARAAMTAAVRHQVAERDKAAGWGEKYAHTEEQNLILRGELDGAVERCARLAQALTELKTKHSGLDEELGEAKIELQRAAEVDIKYKRALKVLSRVQASADAHHRALFNAVQRSGAEIRLHMEDMGGELAALRPQSEGQETDENVQPGRAPSPEKRMTVSLGSPARSTELQALSPNLPMGEAPNMA